MTDAVGSSEDHRYPGPTRKQRERVPRPESLSFKEIRESDSLDLDKTSQWQTEDTTS